MYLNQSNQVLQVKWKQTHTMLCKNNPLYVSIVLIHSFTNRMIWTNPFILMTNLCQKNKKKNHSAGRLHEKDFSVSQILQSNEKYIYKHTQPPNKEGRNLKSHIHLLWFTSHTAAQLNTNLFLRSNCLSSLACHTVYYIFTNRWGWENIKMISKCASKQESKHTEQKRIQ